MILLGLLFPLQSAFERELESRTKRHEMQLTALTENLASVRSELKLTNEKLATLEQIKTEKAGRDFCTENDSLH